MSKIGGTLKKRYRILPYKPGTLRVYWGKAERWDNPSVVYNGENNACSFLAFALEHRRPALEHFKGTFKHEAEPSILQELEARGYDLTTLKFSIKKKEQK